MAGLTRAQILRSKDLEVEEMDIPEWGGSIFIRRLTARDRVAIRTYSEQTTADGVSPSEGFYATKMICDKDGAALFTEEDIGSLEDKNAAVLDRIIYKALEINGLSGKGVEDDAKN